MLRRLKRAAALALVGVAVGWILNSRARHDRAGSRMAPTIGGDTWPPVPVNPVGKG